MTNLLLEISCPDRAVETREFLDGVYLIGREQGDIVLGDVLSSGRHGQLTVSGSTVTYADLGSTNGTYVAGTKIAGPVTMQQGSSVAIGNSRITVLRAPAVQPLAATIVAPPGMMPGMPAPAAQPQPVALAPQPVALAPQPVALAPQPVALAPQPVALAPQPQAQAGGGYQPPPPPGPGGPAFAGAAPQGGGAAVPAAGTPAGTWGPILAESKALLLESWEQFKPRALEASLILGIIWMPIAALNLVYYIPFGGAALGVVAAIILLLTLPLWFALAFISSGTVAEYAMRLHLGQPLTAKQAWKVQFKRLIPYSLSFFVAGVVMFVGLLFFIIPGIMLGCFLLQVFIAEKKTFIDINKRCWELFTSDWKYVVGLAVWPMIVGVVASVASTIVGVFPVIGGLLSTAISCVITAFSVLMATKMYFRVRNKLEGRATEGDAMANLSDVS